MEGRLLAAGPENFMKYVFVLEDDPKFQKEICTALLEIDAQLQIRVFVRLEEFLAWIKVGAREGPLSLAKAGRSYQDEAGLEATPSDKDQLVLIVSKEEFLGSKLIALIKKTRQWMITKKICSEADPTSLVITVFDNPSFDIKMVEDRIINNVIFKPFDLLLLKQHLHFAVHGRHMPTELTVQNLKTTAQIEVIKDVLLERVSELGMTTLSTRPIPLGAVAKYYSELFVSNTHKSVIAICTACEKISKVEEQYRCAFRFYGLDRNQLKKIRMKSVTALSKETVSLGKIVAKGSESKIPAAHLVYVEPDHEQHQSLDHFFKHTFAQVNSVHFQSIAQFLFALDPSKKSESTGPQMGQIPALPVKVSALVINLKNFEHLNWEDDEVLQDSFSKLKEMLQKKFPTLPAMFFCSNRPLTDRFERILANLFQGDLFYDLSDHIHIAKRILMCQKDLLVPKEKLEYTSFDDHRTIKTANAIRVSELSEAGIYVHYHRPITIGTFRKFVLWTPHELGNPEFLASCNFVESKPAEDGTYLNQFVFFGLTDADLKHIRLWILQNYVSTKQAA